MISKYYLLGKNIEKSLSPTFHNQLFKYKHKGHLFQYELYPQSNKIPSVDQIIQDQSISGFSITIPYKKQFIDHKKVQLIGVAKQIKVINTLVKKGRLLKGYNTDYFGIKQALQQQIKNDNNVYLIVGSGATASTFCHYLTDKKVNLILFNRGQQGMLQIKSKYGKNVVQTIRIGQLYKVSSQSKNFLQGITGIINTLPTNALKQHNKMIQKFMKSINLHSKQITYMDASYRKQLCQQNERILLNHFKDIHIIRASGLQMLIWQAVQQNRLFLDQQVYSENQYRLQAETLRQLLKLKDS